MSALVCPGLRPDCVCVGALVLLASVLTTTGADFAPDPSVLGRPLAIAADGRVPVPLFRSAAPPAAPATNDTLELRLLPFRDPLTGETLPVTLSLPGLADTPGAEPGPVVVPADLPRLELVLHAPEPAHTNVFEGALLLRQNGGAWTRHPLALRRRTVARPAGLVLDANLLEAALVRPWWVVVRDRFPGTPAELGRFTVRVREKSGALPLTGLTVRLEQVVKAPPGGFDLARHLAFRVNDQPVPNLAVWPPEAARDTTRTRTVPAGGQAEVSGHLRGLGPGEYQATLRFAAANAAEDDGQKLTLKVQVRHGWFFAVLVLALALGLSWFLTKFLTFARRRLLLRQRLEDLALNTHPAYRNLPAAVWARALLAQTRRLTDRIWLSGHDAIEAKLNQAAALAEVFARAGELRRQLDAAGLPTFVAHRVRTKIENLLGGLAARRFDEAARAAAVSALEALKVWLDDALYVEQYRADLGQAVKRLANRVRPELIPDAAARQKIEDLRAASALQPGEDLPALMRREEAYARLKVLWDRREAPEFAALCAHSGHIEDFFRLADDQVWQQLEAAAKAGRLEVRAPLEAQAFHDICFRATSGQADLDETFLFKHGLVWEWAWNFVPQPVADRASRSGWLWTGWLTLREKCVGTRAPVRRVENTSGPCLVQFAPAPGTLTGTVTLRRRDRALTVDCPVVTVVEAREFGVLRGFEEIEVWATVVALGLALVSGLAARFFNVPTFGSSTDYLTLFLWGVGVDQAKNAWQIFSTYSSPSPPPRS